MKKLALFNSIKRDMEAVEAEIEQQLQHHMPLLRDASIHLFKAGGKRLRPAFVLLTGKLFHYSLEKLLPLAAAMELIHMASLVHDDVVDNSLTRRGIPTVKANWGNRVSLHTGDYLFGKALELIDCYEDDRVGRILSNIGVEMCRGEIQQLVSGFDVNQGLRDYLYRIKRKTALLISASCQLGALLSGANAAQIRTMTYYGYYLGMAFQITDDILDLVADQQELGKPVGGDLRQGIITLPIIYALSHNKERDLLRSLVQKRHKSEPEVLLAIDIIKESGGINYSYGISERYLAKAKDQLKKLPPSTTRNCFFEIADFINARKY